MELLTTAKLNIARIDKGVSLVPITFKCHTGQVKKAQTQMYLKAQKSVCWESEREIEHGYLTNSVESVKVLVAPLCLPFVSPKDCSPPGSSVPGKDTGVGCHSLPQRIFLTQGLN